MESYYQQTERLQQLWFHAMQLLGTPFAAHAMSPGVGIDCVHVNAWCYLKTGFLKSFEPPAYALDEGQHVAPGESKLIKWLDGHPGFVALTLPSPPGRGNGAGNSVGTCFAGGDTICFDTGRSEFHVGLMVGGRAFVHVLAMARGRVVISDIEREVYWRRRVRAVYRPVEGPQ